MVTTTAATAGDLLAEQGIALSETDRTSLYLDQAPAQPHAAAGLPRAGRPRSPRPPPCRTSASRPPTPTPSWATRRSRRAGVDGQQATTYRVTVTDGVETAREALGTTVTRAPVTEQVTVGTKAAPDQQPRPPTA